VLRNQWGFKGFVVSDYDAWFFMSDEADGYHSAHYCNVRRRGDAHTHPHTPPLTLSLTLSLPFCPLLQGGSLSGLSLSLVSLVACTCMRSCMRSSLLTLFIPPTAHSRALLLLLYTLQCCCCCCTHCTAAVACLVDAHTQALSHTLKHSLIHPFSHSLAPTISPTARRQRTPRDTV
jgi:hypothetical protein